jgi:hypothetical protein
MAVIKKKKTCAKGHLFVKTSDCLVYPQCEKASKPKDYFIPKIAAPARRALQNNNIHSVKDLAKWTKEDILSLHGLGPSSMPLLLQALNNEGFSFTASKK